MRTTIDMPDRLLKRVKQVAAERKTTFRALVVDALERSLAERPRSFKLRDASVGPKPGRKGGKEEVSTEAINEAIEAQRESRFIT
jgi:predicted transcriptional regulator